jgi:glucoamylase
MQGKNNYAPGWPGITPTWTSSAKSGVGPSLSSASRVWFTLSHGICNEIYYPRVDHACTRDFGLLVTDGRTFFSEEKRHARHAVAYLAEGVPAYRLVNTCTERRYRIEKEIIAAPHREAILQRTRFTPLRGRLEDYHLYALLAPHLGNRGWGNTAWVGEYKGVPMLFAERESYALALASSAPWLKRSAGFVGVSDGWQDVYQHKQMTWTYAHAENGNVALTGEVDLNVCGGECVLALGFGTSTAEAGHCALASLQEDFALAQAEYIRTWHAWHQPLLRTQADPGDRGLYAISLAVLRTHEAKRFLGGMIASLSMPWGFAKGDEDLGGYHLVWPRDLMEAGSALLAAGARQEAHRVLQYLRATQEADGHWPQNMWMDGTPYWNGVQMDETALPILLVNQARRAGDLLPPLETEDLPPFWPMVQRAAGYLVRNGPVTPQERWEMDPGYSPFTLAAEVAALLAAAEMADQATEPRMATYLRETADYWNVNIERWTYVTDTELDWQLGIAGHYVRIAPPEKAEAASPRHGFVPIKGRPPEQYAGPSASIVGPDALALVRFGLRAASDPRILNTVQAIDALLKVETPTGPAWRRYVDDLYGEHADGTPFNGTGRGRAWPLLTGERAHYELAAGRRWEAERLLRALESFANEGGMIPEQLWDADNMPERELFCGRASGSAMPLVWAHAEYIKLRRSLHDDHVFDLPPQTVQRYVVEQASSSYTVWRFNNKCDTMPTGKTLRLEALAPAVIRWSPDAWRTVHVTASQDTGLGVHVADLPTDTLRPETTIVFTFYWPEARRWEGVDFMVQTTALNPAG